MDPSWSWTPALAPTAACSLGFELAESPLVKVLVDGDAVDHVSLIDEVLAADAACAGRIGSPSSLVGRRVGFGVSAPIFLNATGPVAAGGPAFGDTRLWLPVNVYAGDLVSVDVMPVLALPTGPEARDLGDDGPGGSLLAAAGLANERWSVTANAGITFRPQSGDDRWKGGTELPLSLGFGVGNAAKLAVLAEARAAASLGGGKIPVEGRLAVKGRPTRALWWTAGVGSGLVPGVGAAVYRVSGTVGFTPFKGESVVEPVIDELLTALQVSDVEGHPIRGAHVIAGRNEYYTDIDGLADLPGVRRNDLVVQAMGYQDLAIEQLPDDEVVPVTLLRGPVPFAVRVVDPDGQPVAAQIGLVGPVEATKLGVDEVGTQSYTLAPGDWTLTVEAAGFGPQRRTIVVPGDRIDPMRVDAVLTPVAEESTDLVVHVADPSGDPVEGAMIRIGGRVVGTTGTGGDVAIESLARGAVDVTAESGDFTSPAPRMVQVGESSSIDLQLGWPPGTVILRAVDFEGRPTDASAAFNGPTAVLAPVHLGPDGERLFHLTPGAWTVQVTSPTLGAQDRDIEVGDAPGHVQYVDIAFRPDENGLGDVILHVRDPDGLPIPSAAVTIDGHAIGESSSLGTITLHGLASGPREVAITGAYLRPWGQQIHVVDGLQSVDAVVGWQAGAVRVAGIGPDGAPVAALVHARGPARVEPVDLGPDGVSLFTLAPGKWHLDVGRDGYADQSRDVAIAADSERLARVDFRLQPPKAQGKLELAITDPEGLPVADAEVTVDGKSVGKTSNDGTIAVEGLDEGPLKVEVKAPGLALWEQDVAVTKVATPQALQLDWAPGAVRVKVADAAGATDALVTIAGPEPVAPQRVGTDGETVLDLPPGTWFLSAANGTGSATEQTVVVTADGTVQDVALNLAPIDLGQTVLTLRVDDAEGAPIPHAKVTIDGKDAGVTTAGGVLVAKDVAPGPHDVKIEATDAWEPAEFALTTGTDDEHHAILPWATSPVAITVTDPNGLEVPAELTLEGPDGMAPSGPAPTFDLRPGTWTAFAKADGFIVGQVTFTVDQGGKPVAVPIVLNAAPPQASVTERTIEVQQRIQFAINAADLGPGSSEVLDEIAGLVRSNPRIVRLEIQGHTDDTGPVAYNLDLSNRRAESVRQALIARGVPAERLVAVGYGVLRPLVPNVDDASRAINRRVAFVIVETSTPWGTR
jgi:outer membrane protein OmpA-like peptidoglycan-associated protein